MRSSQEREKGGCQNSGGDLPFDENVGSHVEIEGKGQRLGIGVCVGGVTCVIKA